MSTLCFGIYKRLSISLFWFIIAIVFATTTQFIQKILLPKDIYLWIVPICLLFFIAVTLTTYAIYLRLSIRMHWLRITFTLLIAESLLLYFSFIDPILEARLMTVAFACFFICLNNPKQLFHANPIHKIDILLKYSFYSMAVAIILRAVILIICFNEKQWVAQHQTIWATTQFIMLFFVVLLISIFITITTQEIIQYLKQKNLLDPLTKLPNQHTLTKTLHQNINIATTDPYTILICNIDHFKKINQQYGCHIGDVILKHLSQYLEDYLRPQDFIARTGGDEFAIVLCNLPEQIAIECARDICKNIENHPVRIDEFDIYITISIGLIFFDHIHEYDEAFQEAIDLLHAAKKSGRNTVKYKFSLNRYLDQ